MIMIGRIEDIVADTAQPSKIFLRKEYPALFLLGQLAAILATFKTGRLIEIRRERT